MGLLRNIIDWLSPEPKKKPDKTTEPGVIYFKLDIIEQGRLTAFKEKHKKSCPGITAIGGKFSYTFTPTGIGTAVVIRCNACGEEQDITNIDLW